MFISDKAVNMRVQAVVSTTYKHCTLRKGIWTVNAPTLGYEILTAQDRHYAAHVLVGYVVEHRGQVPRLYSTTAGQGVRAGRIRRTAYELAVKVTCAKHWSGSNQMLCPDWIARAGPLRHNIASIRDYVSCTCTSVLPQECLYSVYIFMSLLYMIGADIACPPSNTRHGPSEAALVLQNVPDLGAQSAYMPCHNQLV